jgi:hypothetical protein
MHVMAVGAGNIVERMDAAIPIVKVEGCICGMTFKAYQGLRRGGKIL